MTYLFLALSFVLLMYGGDFLVEGSVQIAKKLKVSNLLIGLTLVGFGTSTPELATSLQATFQGASGIALGNVVGSNVANILLVLGVAALLNPIDIDIQAFKRDGLFLFLSSAALIGIALFVSKISFFYGLLLTSGLVFYIVYGYFSEKKSDEEIPEEERSKHATLKNFSKVVFGIALTVYGAHLLVQNAILIAKGWGVSESVIGLTVVAIGTSLPELATSIAASFKKQNAIAFGNVVGSNIYNALFILGVTALFIPVSIPKDASLTGLYAMGFVTLLLILIGGIFKRFNRLTGLLFLALYGVYVLCLMG
ncbi:MAG: calcium/sodium antiporter [Alphaproteobacteria bacterium]|nr:calcium/sodium antiporter [Alphaproteobacteria bacterium]